LLTFYAYIVDRSSIVQMLEHFEVAQVQKIVRKHEKSRMLRDDFDDWFKHVNVRKLILKFDIVE
jgi:hypothetical protein